MMLRYAHTALAFCGGAWLCPTLALAQDEPVEGEVRTETVVPPDETAAEAEVTTTTRTTEVVQAGEGPADEADAAATVSTREQTAKADDIQQAPEPLATYFPDEGFAIKSADQQFKLRIGLQAAYRLAPRWVEGEAQPRRTFFVMRPFLEGHIFRDWVRFWTSFEFASNPPYILDSYVELAPTPEFVTRIGQFWSPFSRHEYFGPHQILFPEWTLVADYFWPGRDRGVAVLGSLFDGKLDYYTSLVSGTPLRQIDTIDGNWAVAARLTANPMGPTGSSEAPYITDDEVPFRVSLTAQGYYGDIQAGEGKLNESAFRVETVPTDERREQAMAGADLWLQGPVFAFLAEGYVRRTDIDGPEPAFTAVGAWAQLGVMVVDRLVDVGVRASYLDPSTDLDDDTFAAIEGQVGYYPFSSQNLVVKARYGYGHQQDPGDTGGVALPTDVGSTHLATLQLGLAF